MGSIKDYSYEIRGGGLIETAFQDLHYGLRKLGKHPGFSFVAVLTLSLGISANTAIFSVVHAVLLRPLPFPDSDPIVVGWKQDPVIHNPFIELSIAEIKDWQAQSQSFTDLAAMPTTVYGYGYVLTGSGEPLQLESAKVTGRFFSVLGANAELGRVFDESDDRVNGPRVVVISQNLWRDRFGGDPNIAGKSIRLNKDSFTVLGVMPASFVFPRGIDLWIPLLTTVSQENVADRTMTYLQIIGRIKPGVTIAQSEAELNTIVARIANKYPETQANNQRVVLKSLDDHLFGDAKPALWALFASTGLLLLIASGNIANLLLARATTRRREFALRAALGASRFRIVRQLLIESTLLATVGSALGVLLAFGLIHALVAIAPSDIPRFEDVRINGPALLVSLVSMLVSVAVFGLLPAISISRFNLNETLSAGSAKLTMAKGAKRLRGSLVIGQVALTLVLLAGAMLILRSFVNLSRVPLGFDPHNVLTMQLRMKGAQYSELIERLEGKPGISAASGVLTRPLEGTVGWDWDFTIDGQTADSARANPDANFEVVHPHYFTTFGIPLKAGRAFDSHDASEGQQVAIVSETLAQRYFGSGANAIGKRIKLGDLESDSPWRQIVGVAGDVRYRALQDVRLDLYIPYSQWPMGHINHFAIRSNLASSEALGVVRREVHVTDPTVAVSRIATMDELVATQLARPRFSTILLNWLSLLAVLLAGTGIYGVMAYVVAERTSELGVRIALGAQLKDIVKLVLGQAMILVVAGIALGLVASFALTRLLTMLLFGVSPTDPMTLIGIATLVTVVALLASWIPVRRATRVDPLVVLKYE